MFNIYKGNENRKSIYLILQEYNIKKKSLFDCIIVIGFV